MEISAPLAPTTAQEYLDTLDDLLQQRCFQQAEEYRARYGPEMRTRMTPPEREHAADLGEYLFMAQHRNDPVGSSEPQPRS